MKTLGEKIIFESPEEIVNPEHTALVLWDCQNLLVDRIFNRDEFLSNLKSLLDSARQHQVPVIYAKITSVALSFQSSWDIYKQMQRSNLDDPSKVRVHNPDDPSLKINETIAPVEGNLVINRPTTGLFLGTAFQHWMHNRGIQSIIFTGISTEQGVETEVRNAGKLGFYPVVASDCVSTMDKKLHDMALEIMSSIYIVISSKDIMKAWT